MADVEILKANENIKALDTCTVCGEIYNFSLKDEKASVHSYTYGSSA